MIPAALTRTSIPLKRRRVVSMTRRLSGSRARSAGITSTISGLIPAATEPSSDSLRATMTTCAPRLEASKAVAFPIPLEAPVTRRTLFAKSFTPLVCAPGCAPCAPVPVIRQDSSGIEQRSGTPEDTIEHRLGQFSRERVLLARMEGRKQRLIPIERVFRSVCKQWPNRQRGELKFPE